MTSRINRVPRGLQDLLNSVNLGVNPSDLLLTVQPGVDLFPFWGSEKLALFSAIGAAAVGGTDVQSHIIPNGEAWMPLAWSIDANLVTVGDSIAFGARLDGHGMVFTGVFGAGVFLAYQDRIISTVAVQRATISYSWPIPVLLGPGNRFVTRCDNQSNSAGAATLVSSLYYWRFLT
jgi:hypothetical protein